MKKIFFIFVLVFCLTAGFAETGYRGHEWFSKYDTFPQSGQEQNNMAYGTTFPVIYKKTILETQTYLFYDMNLNTAELQAAGYLIPKSKTELLKKDMKSKKSTVIKMDFSDFESEPGDTQVESDFYIFTTYSFFSREFENFTEQDKEELKKTFKNEAGKITIYDYNDDTRCYIFENAVPDRTVVIYVPHDQDF